MSNYEYKFEIIDSDTFCIKPVKAKEIEPPKPKLCEILHVEVGEHFDIGRYKNCCVNKAGYLFIDDDDMPVDQAFNFLDTMDFCDLINSKYPAWTDRNKREFDEQLEKLGFQKFFAKEETPE